MACIHDPPKPGNVRAISHRLWGAEECLDRDLPAIQHVSSANYWYWLGTNVFQEDIAFIAPPIAMSQRRNKAPWIHLEKDIRLLIRIDLDVLIRNSLCLEGYPNSLGKGA